MVKIHGLTPRNNGPELERFHRGQRSPRCSHHDEMRMEKVKDGIAKVLLVLILTTEVAKGAAAHEDHVENDEKWVCIIHGVGVGVHSPASCHSHPDGRVSCE